MKAYGVSVETVDEARAALQRPHLASIQIILNTFRRKPLEQVLPAAGSLPALTAEQRSAMEGICERRIRQFVHSRW